MTCGFAGDLWGQHAARLLLRSADIRRATSQMLLLGMPTRDASREGVRTEIMVEIDLLKHE